GWSSRRRSGGAGGRAGSTGGSAEPGRNNPASLRGSALRGDADREAEDACEAALRSHTNRDRSYLRTRLEINSA
ncbi:hypothetical protein Nmel_012109, partial [Mimus melanotis]